MASRRRRGRPPADRCRRRRDPPRRRQRGRRRAGVDARLVRRRAAADRARRRRLHARGRRPTASRCCSTSSSRRPGAAPTSSAGAAGRRRRLVRRRRAGVPHRRLLVRHVRHAGGDLRRRGPLRHGPAGRPRGARRRARARRGDGQQRAGVRVRDPRADLLLDGRVPRAVHARGAGAARGRRAARPGAGRLARAARRRGRGAVLRGRHRRGDLRARVRARRHAHARGPGRLPAEPREPVRVRYRGRDVLTNPPPSAGGTLLAYALALLERAPGPPGRARARRGDGARAGRAHAGVPHRPRRARLPRPLHGQPARIDHAHLGARRRRLGVLGHVHERRGLGHRRARHRRARQQHDGRAGPVAARLLHAPAGRGGCRR